MNPLATVVLAVLVVVGVVAILWTIYLMMTDEGD